MDSTGVAMIIGLGVLLLLSAFFSASEMAFSSLNLIRMKSLAADGNKKAARALALTEKYDKLLSTVLIGNNLVNIASTSIATVLFVGWFGNLGVTLSTIVMTVLVLIFGEISPKTIAKETPEKFAMATAPILNVLLIVFTPVNALLSAWKRLILRLFRIDGGGRAATEQELLTYVEEVREGGAISENEETMLRSVIEFDDLRALDIATPRVDITAIADDDEPHEIAATFHETGYSRLPVYNETIDDITGMVLEKDFSYYVQTLGQKLATVVRPVLYVTKSVKISALLKELQAKKTHMAIIMDEYGGTLGLVTVEDILEELVGEIWDEHDQVRQPIQQLADGRYRVLGDTDIDDMMALFGKSSECTAQTVAGWLMERTGRIPASGESHDIEGIRVFVSEMLKNRILSVIVGGVPNDAAAEDGAALTTSGR